MRGTRESYRRSRRRRFVLRSRSDTACSMSSFNFSTASGVMASRSASLSQRNCPERRTVRPLCVGAHIRDRPRRMMRGTGMESPWQDFGLPHGGANGQFSRHSEQNERILGWHERIFLPPSLHAGAADHASCSLSVHHVWPLHVYSHGNRGTRASPLREAMCGSAFGVADARFSSFGCTESEQDPTSYGEVWFGEGPSEMRVHQAFWLTRGRGTLSA